MLNVMQLNFKLERIFLITHSFQFSSKGNCPIMVLFMLIKRLKGFNHCFNEAGLLSCNLWHTRTFLFLKSSSCFWIVFDSIFFGIFDWIFDGTYFDQFWLEHSGDQRCVWKLASKATILLGFYSHFNSLLVSLNIFESILFTSFFLSISVSLFSSYCIYESIYEYLNQNI